MAKCSGPLFSESVSGSLSKLFTFSNRKSGQQVRYQKRQKNNPTDSQLEIRDAYLTAVDDWNALDQSEKDVYIVRAKEMKMTGYNLYIQENFSLFSYDPDVKNYINAVEAGAGTISDDHKMALNTFILGLKAANLYTKLKVMYPFMGGNAYSHALNFIDPRDSDSAFRITFTGNVTHQSTGVKPDGATATYDTHFAPNIEMAGSYCMGVLYLRTNVVANQTYDIAVGPTLTNSFFMNCRNGGNQFVARNAQSVNDSLTNMTNIGFFANSREYYSSFRLYYPAGQYSKGRAMTGLVDDTLKAWGGIPAFPQYNSREQSFMAFGISMLQDDVNILKSLLLTLMTSLGRNV